MTPRLRALIASATLMVCPGAFAAVTPWPDAPYSYFANNAKLEAVLADFATGFSLSLAIQPELTAQVNGRFAAATPTEFLSRLASVYGFVWYAHAGTLFVSRSSGIVTRGVPAPGGSVAGMRKALMDLGVLEPRFGWGELGESGMAMVSGPPSYVQLIETTIRNLPARAQQLMVFRLKHASAIDRTVSYRDQQQVTPGMASMLRTLVASGSVPSPAAVPGGGSGAGPALRTAPGVGESAGGTGLASAQATGQYPSAVPTATAPQTSRASIQADARLNAVIIQDLPERMPLYEQLVAQLDVPTELVEIEAMIVDISTDRATELGVDWSGRIGNASFGFGDPKAAPGSSALVSFASGSTAAGNFLLTRLRALESNGDADVQSRPSVLTTENLAAVLDLSETFYIETKAERVAQVTPVTAGTSLRVTPHVLRQDGKLFVQMRIDIEDGQVTDNVIGSLPTVRRTSVSTEATVGHGDALLIAGHSRNSNIASRQQVPVLGELPGIGMLFSNRSRTLQKRERMFLIRPKVVGLAGQPIESAQIPHKN
jgi:type III secretion protein C